MRVNWIFSKTYHIKCSDGSIRIIYKNIDLAFPLSITEVQKKFETDIDIKKKALVKLNHDYANKIGGLLYNISDLNQSLMMSLRSAYIGFQSDPCKNSDFFNRQVERSIDGQQRLMELKTQITGLIALAESYPNTPEKVLPIYYKLIAQMGGNINESISLEIKENRKNAKKWIGGQNG